MSRLNLKKILVWSLLIAGCGDAAKKDNITNNKEDNQVTTNTKVKTILFFGDSLTAGYGLDNPITAFPGLIQDKIDSARLNYKVVNAGVSGETTAGGLSRIDWILKQPVDIFVLELGANDGLRGLPVAETERNLQAIVDKVKAKYPEARLVLLGMMVPPNMGKAYASSFQAVFPAIASKNKMTFMPFLLENVGGIRELNQGDGIHPTAKGHQVIAENLWPILHKIL